MICFVGLLPRQKLCWRGDTFRMLVTECSCTHVVELNGSLTAAVYKSVALNGMEFRGRNYLSQLLHICRLDVDNIYIKCKY